MNLQLLSTTVGAVLRSKGKALKVLSSVLAYDGWSISTSDVASDEEVALICQRVMEMIPSDYRAQTWVGLPQSTSFVRIDDVAFFTPDNVRPS